MDKRKSYLSVTIINWVFIFTIYYLPTIEDICIIVAEVHEKSNVKKVILIYIDMDIHRFS